MLISTREALAAKKLVGGKLRKAGLVDDLQKLDVDTLDKRGCHDAKGAIAKIARELLDSMKDNDDEIRVAEHEQAHDALMGAFDGIEARLDVLNGTSMRPTYANVTINGRGEAVGGDEPTEAFALRSGQSFTDHVRAQGRGADEYAGLSTGAYLRAMVLGPKNEAEKRALAEGTDSAGGYSVPDILSARMIDRMRAASVVFRAGAQTVPLGSDVNYIAKVATDPVPAWRLENAAVAESDPTFGRVTLTARSLAVLVKASRELLQDSLNMETVLPALLATALAQELDRVALIGTGSAPQPRGVQNFAGLTANSFAGGALASYGPLIQARTALRTVNSDVSAYILHPRDEGTLAGLTATDDQPLMVPPAIANTPFLVTSKIPTNLGAGTNESVIFAGDWAKLLVGIRSEIRIEILKERFADNHQFGFVAHMRADVAAEHEAAFTVLDGITA